MLARDAFLTSALREDAFRLDYAPELGDALGDVGSELRRELVGPACHVFVSAKVPTPDTACVAALEGLGFRVVDTNVQLERELAAPWPKSPTAAGYAVGWSAPEDQEAVAHLAGQSFRSSRFHLDPRIPREAADRVKACWAANFFSGERGNAMAVAHREDEAVGFLLLLHAGSELVIDLVATGAEHRGRGLAAAMIRFAARKCPDFETLVVGTQVANTPSLRLYEKLGFRVRGASYVLHRHP